MSVITCMLREVWAYGEKFKLCTGKSFASREQPACLKQFNWSKTKRLVELTSRLSS
jgi:hypothetical protein